MSHRVSRRRREVCFTEGGVNISTINLYPASMGMNVLMHSQRRILLLAIVDKGGKK